MPWINRILPSMHLLMPSINRLKPELNLKCLWAGSFTTWSRKQARSCLQRESAAPIPPIARTTRVPHVRSCPLGGWSGARVEIGILRGFLVSWFLCFLVSWIQSFLVSWLLVYWFLGCWFLGFEASWLQSFNVSKIYLFVLSYFVEDIDPTSKMSNNSLNGSRGFLWRPDFRQFPKSQFPNTWDLRKSYVRK